MAKSSAAPTHVDIPHVKPTRTQLKTFSQYFGQKSLKIQISHVLSFLSICGSNNININTWAMLPEEHVGSLIKQRPRKHQLELVEQTLGQKLSKQRELQLSQFHRSCGKMNAFAS